MRSFLRSCRVGLGVSGLWAGGALLGTALIAPGLYAQQAGTVSGSVVVESSGGPLAGVQITAGARGASTDVSGQFRITGLAGDSVTLVVRRIGFAPLERRVRIGEANIRLRLRESLVSLNSVVVTGTTGPVAKRELGVSVAQIDAAAVVRTQPVQDVQGLINGRAPGVTVLQNSGVVGSGATVRIRGGSSLSLSNQPLIYVDGVRVDNSQGTGPANQSFGASTTSRWNDLDPNTIESMEIVRGPAATALYGTEAVNGVIQIITKRGAQGKTRWDFSTKQGKAFFADVIGRFPTNYGKVNGQIVSENIAQVRADSGLPLFRDGRINENTLAVSGGSPTIQYYLSGNTHSDQGVEPTNAQIQYGGRGNVHVTPNKTLDITASGGYVRGTTNLSCEAGCGGVMFSGFYATPASLGTPKGGFESGTPEAYYQEYHFDQLFNRFTGSIQVTHTPTKWFTQQLIVGTDYAHEQNDELAGVNYNLSYFFGTDADSGYKNVGFRDNTTTSTSYHATFKAPLSASLQSSTTVGGDFYLRNSRFAGGSGSDFPAPGLTALSSTTAGLSAYEYTRDNNSLGVLGQEELAWKDRLFLSAGVRSDQNSSFGSNFKNVVYPHVSLSYVLSDEPFFKLPFVSQLKLRGAYGQSGEAPPLFVSIQSYSTTATGVTPSTIGNPNLQPERGYETEVGLDASFLNDRAGMEFTYYNGGTKNEILQVPVSPSTGFGANAEYINAGRITRHGVELALRATPIQTGAVSWDVTYNVATNSNKVDNLGGNQFLQASSYVQNRVGYPLFSWFAPKVVNSTLDPVTGKVTNILCEDGKGGTVACSSAPNVYLGRSLPNVEGSFGTGIRFLTNFRVAGLIDYKTGYKKLNGDERVRCQIFRQCRANFYPAEFSPSVVGAYTLGTNAPSAVIEDASFAKLRELSLTWTVPESLLRNLRVGGASLTIAGRNLHTWTNYPGLEPEASFQGGTRGAAQWEQAVLPQLRQYTTTLNLTF
ncbi:MAG: TonB-dependent receptor domain-containing protein [Gemmatimonadaceae bacterium]